MYAMAETSLEHEAIGSISGISRDKVKQFLGIQYATLKDRLASPVIKTEYSSPVQAIKFG